MEVPGGLGSLQWGHGDEAVEEVQSTREDRLPCHVLQWGHGDEAVEEERVDQAIKEEQRFNGATAMKPWKSIQARAVCRSECKASMGPRR